MLWWMMAGVISVQRYVQRGVCSHVVEGEGRVLPSKMVQPMGWKGRVH